MEYFRDEEALDMINYRLETIPEELKGVKCLRINKNQIQELSFPEECILESLDVADNQIRDMSPISCLKNLRYLDIGYNLLTEIKDLEIEGLKHLYLMSNDIKEIRNINYKNLINLDISNNPIKNIENINAPMLEGLHLCTAQIKNVPDLTHLSKLKFLDLQYNEIEEFDCNNIPSSLEILFLEGNKNLKFLKNIEKLSNLKTINISKTKINKSILPKNLDIW